ncbi:PREDICTED: uncharacterized protein LOC109580266 [Amphimedon queenslandica]|nr:PREDICTED: uncharacterized protein LOC109580266 [Amphimedon queenslandica]|eukprot:XP_019848831.1 PREDICTED: uncharacterized protein LOC109580266 [Amphimedon queenslandica]
MVTKLEDKIEKMKEANVVLRSKIPQQVNTTDPHGIREPQHPHYPLPSNIAVRPNSTPAPVPEPVVQSDGDSMLVVSKTEGVTPAHHTDSDSVPDDSPAFMSKEEMARMFKPYNQQGSSDWSQSLQQVEDSSLAAQKVQPTEESLVAEQHRQELARKVDDALLEVDRMRRQAEHQQTNNDSNTQDQSRTKGQLTREEAEKGRRPNTFQDTASKEKPVHPQPKANDNQGKQQRKTDDDSDSDIEENKLIDNIDEEIQQMAEDVRKGSRGPSTAEVLFDDGNSSLPYDPNLVCPKCGKQYRVGEIQKLRRHINEFCTGIR